MLKRLRLKQGDILLVRADAYGGTHNLMKQLMEAGMLAGITDTIPIVIVTGKHDIEVLRKKHAN